MNRIFLFLVLLLLMVAAVSADDIQSVKAAYTSSKESFDIIGTIKGWLGYDAQPERIYVSIEGKVVAELPADSKFIDVPIHDKCLEYQYGTNGWYNCEMMIK